MVTSNGAHRRRRRPRRVRRWSTRPPPLSPDAKRRCVCSASRPCGHRFSKFPRDAQPSLWFFTFHKAASKWEAIGDSIPAAREPTEEWRRPVAGAIRGRGVADSAAVTAQDRPARLRAALGSQARAPVARRRRSASLTSSRWSLSCAGPPPRSHRSKCR